MIVLVVAVFYFLGLFSLRLQLINFCFLLLFVTCESRV